MRRAFSWRVGYLCVCGPSLTAIKKEAGCLPVCVVKRLKLLQRVFGCHVPRLVAPAGFAFRHYQVCLTTTPAGMGLGESPRVRHDEQCSSGGCWVLGRQSSNRGGDDFLLMIIVDKARARGQNVKRVGVVKDKGLKMEDDEASHTLCGSREGGPSGEGSNSGTEEERGL